MDAVLRLLGRWRLALVCCTWLLSLLSLIGGEGYRSFLTPGFLPVLILAIFVLLPMAFLSLFRGRGGSRITGAEALGAAIVLLPLAYIHGAGDAVLSSGAFTARFVGGGAVTGPGSPSPAAAGREVTLLDLFTDADAYAGRTVAVVGMLSKENEQVAKLMGRKTPLVFRFVITCCAADAAPVAVLLDGPVETSLADDSWVEATGVVRVREAGGGAILALEEAVVQSVSRPREPYLSMQWGVF